MEQSVSRCAICGTQQQLKCCAKCKSIYYCSTAHQHIDWPQHKQTCRLIAQQKENNKMQQLAVAAATLGINSYEPNNVVAEQQTTTNMTNPTSREQILFKHPAEVLSNTNRTYHNEPNACNIEQRRVSGETGNVDNSVSVQQQWPLADLRLQSQNNQMQQQHTPHYTPHTQQQPPQQQQFVFYNNQNGQSDRNNSYQIGQGNENAIGITNERRYDELCRNIIHDMNKYGLSVVDDFLGSDKGFDVLHEVHRMYSEGVFKDGQLANNLRTDKDLRKIRGDKITWVKGIEAGCASVGYLINQIDAVICRANTMKNNGILGDYNIRERTKAMVACYPGSGSEYVMHVDNPNKDGRVITAIYYLNVNWDTKRSGGVLRIVPKHGEFVADIEPKFDRLIFFWSDSRNPHEVQPAHRTRYAITVWYFDANEREAALNRCKYQNHLNNTTSNAAPQQQQQQQQQQHNATQQTNSLKTTTTTQATIITSATTGTQPAPRSAPTAKLGTMNADTIANAHLRNTILAVDPTIATNNSNITTNTTVTKLNNISPAPTIPAHTTITTTT